VSDVQQATERVAEAVENLNLAMSDLPEDWVAAVHHLHTVRLARQLLHTLEQGIESHVHRLWKTEGITSEQTVDGVGTVKVRSGYSRTNWQHDQLAKEVLERHLQAEEGVLPDPWTVRDWLFAAMGKPSYWRKTELEALGIDPAEFSEWVQGRPSVQLG